MSTNETQLNNIWTIRENITEHLSKEKKHIYKFDISIKLSDLETIKTQLEKHNIYIYLVIF